MRKPVCILFAVGSLFSVQGVAFAQDAHVETPLVPDNRGMTKRSQSIFHPNNVLPKPVQALKIAQVGTNNLTVVWQKPNTAAMADLAGYHVRINQQAPIALSRDVHAFTFSPVLPGARYDISVAPVNPLGNEGEAVNVSTVSLLANPHNITATGLDSQAKLRWQAAKPYQFVSAYKVYVSDAPFDSVRGLVPRFTLDQNTREAVLNGLKNGHTYYVAVSVVNTAGLETESIHSVPIMPEQDQQGPVIADVLLDGIPLSNVENNVVVDGILTTSVNDPSGVSAVSYYLSPLNGNAPHAKPSYKKPLGDVFSAKNGFEHLFEIDHRDDGEYTLHVVARDSRDNETIVSYPIHLLKSVPDAPKILDASTSHASVQAKRKYTRHAQCPVVVTAKAGQQVQLVVNGESLAWQTVDEKGQVIITASLTEGLNTLSAVAKNRAGISEASESLGIVLNPNIPAKLSGLVATAQPQGHIALHWQPDSSRKTITYNVYRSDSPFLTAEAGERLNIYPIRQPRYEDLPALDGHYYYRVEAVSEDGLRGEASAQASAESDRTKPTARAIWVDANSSLTVAAHSSEPRVNALSAVADSDVLGEETVQITLELDEPVPSLPYLALQAKGKTPLGVTLTPVPTSQSKDGATAFVGELTVPADYHSGEAQWVFSARDRVGNRGTHVATGQDVITIDTTGPQPKAVTFYTANIIQNKAEHPAVIRFAVELDEALAEPPTFALRGVAGETLPITSLAQQSSTRWLASVTLPADLGRDHPAYLHVIYEAVDTLGNRHRGRLHPAEIEVYQTALPALSAPAQLTAMSAPDGHIALQWSAVYNAAGYEVFRRGINEDAFESIARVMRDDSNASQAQGAPDVVHYTDEAADEGRYVYAVASVRRLSTKDAVTEEAISSYSDEVVADTDRHAPSQPTNLSAKLDIDGVHLQWQSHVVDVQAKEEIPEVGTTEIGSRYQVYRLAGNDVISKTDTLQADTLLTDATRVGEPIAGLQAIDSTPLMGEVVYVVTALDDAGNESLPSAPLAVDSPLLPVNQWVVRQKNGGAPMIGWQHPAYFDPFKAQPFPDLPEDRQKGKQEDKQEGKQGQAGEVVRNGDIAGFDVHLKTDHKSAPLNDQLLTNNQFVDTGFTHQARHYQVFARDADGKHSLARDIVLPYVSVQFAEAANNHGVTDRVSDSPETHRRLQRGVMNALAFDIQSDTPIDDAQLSLSIAGKTYLSDVFDVKAQQDTHGPYSTRVQMAVVGEADWQANEIITTSLITTSLTAQRPESATSLSDSTRANRIEIQHTFEQAVTDNRYVVTLDSKNTVRGEVGQVRLQLENRSALPISVDLGAEHQSAVQFQIKDADGNVYGIVSGEALRDAVVHHTGVSSDLNHKTANDKTINDKALNEKGLLTIAPHSTYTSPWLDMPIPGNVPDTVFLHVDVAQLTYRPTDGMHPMPMRSAVTDLATTDLATSDAKHAYPVLSGMSHRQLISTVRPAYYADLQTVTPAIAYADQAITLQGEVRDSLTHQRVPHAMLDLVLDVAGFEKTVTIASDLNGMFRYQYQPTEQESGQYRFSLIHPSSTDRPDQGGFAINRLHTDVSAVNVVTPRDENADITLKVRNPQQLDYPDVYWDVEGGLPEGVTLTVPNPRDIAGHSETVLPVTFHANTQSAAQGEVILQLKSSLSGHQPLVSVVVDYRLGEAHPALSYHPAQIETGVTMSGQVSETVHLENHGHAMMQNVNLQLLAQDNSPASSWITLKGASALGDIAPGERVGVSVTLSPQGQLRPRVYHYKLRVTSNNAPARDIPIIALVSEQSTGGLQFKVDNLYSGSLDAQGKIVRGKAGALVRFQHKAIPSIHYDAMTDEAGEIYLPDMEKGAYHYLVSAPHHDELSGEIQIAPSIVRNLEVFLNYQAAESYSAQGWTAHGWAVQRWASHDWTALNGEMNALHSSLSASDSGSAATIESDVPAAVVTLSPSVITLPTMMAGDVVYGELTLTNHGLLPAESLALVLPPSDEYFAISFLPSAIPASLAPKAQVRIPYRVVSLQTRSSQQAPELAPQLTRSVSAPNAQCAAYARCTLGEYRYTSTLSTTRQAQARACFIEPVSDTHCVMDETDYQASPESSPPIPVPPFNNPFGWYGYGFRLGNDNGSGALTSQDQDKSAG